MCVCVCVCVSCLVMSDSFATPWTVAHQAPLCPLNFSGKDTGGVAISFSRGSSWPRDQTQISCITGRFFIVWATRETLYIYVIPSFPDSPRDKQGLSSKVHKGIFITSAALRRPLPAPSRPFSRMNNLNAFSSSCSLASLRLIIFVKMSPESSGLYPNFHVVLKLNGPQVKTIF